MALSKEEKVLPLSKLTVFQVVTTNEALVKEDSDSAKSDNQIYFLISDGEELYYDKQKIRVPNGKVVKMIGVYQYESRGKICTVPAIRIDPLPQKNKSK